MESSTGSWFTQETAKEHSEPFSGIINDHLQHYFDLFVMGVGCAFISFVGLITNTINVIVFFRQGLKDSMTITLFSLSTSDLGADVFTLFVGLSTMAKACGLYADKVDWSAVMYVCFAWSRAACLDISMLTTVYISVERSLSVTMPFRIRGMFTPSRATKILIAIYITIISCYLPVFATQGLVWKRSDSSNSTTRLSFWFGSGRVRIEAVSNVMTGISLPTLSYVTVIVCTYLMIRALMSSSEFRNQAASGWAKPAKGLNGSKTQGRVQRTLANDSTERDYRGENDERIVSKSRSKFPSGSRSDLTIRSGSKVTSGSGSDHPSGSGSKLSKKDRKVVKLVTLVACAFITCTLPQVLMVYGRRFIPDLNVGARYENLHMTLFAFVFLVGGINASTNMFIYLNASSRYRTVFFQTFFRAVDEVGPAHKRDE